MSNPHFKRNELLLGADACDRLQNSFVVIVGMGAVGSFAAEAIVRAGVGKLRIIDCDEVEASNTNRQLYALASTQGQRKVEVAKQRLQDANPSLQINAHHAFIDQDNLDIVFSGTPDVLIDCIDTLHSKVALLTAAVERSITTVSSMGAARRKSLSDITVSDLSKTTHCPLAAQLRKHLRTVGITNGIHCVHAKSRPEPFTHVSPEGDSTRMPFGSLCTVTGSFGLLAAHTAIGLLYQQ